MTFPKALPKLLVVLHPICIVDVSGIDDSSTLERTLLATLWEHGYGRQIELEKGDKVILSLEPFREHWDYHYLVIQEPAFSLSTQQNTDSGQPSPLFKLCAESSASGTFQMFVQIFYAVQPQAGFFRPDSHFWESQVPASKLLAITIVSRNDRIFLCQIHLENLNVQTIGSILNCIVQELQVIQYYFHPGRPTDLASAHKSAPAWGAKDFDFVKYFEQDIDSNGHLTLSANVYKAKPALKLLMAVPSSDVHDTASLVGQKKLTHTIVKVYARRESDFACMVDLTGIEDTDAPAIRQRITHALTEHNYLIRGQLLLTDKDVSTATCHEPLTDEQLFVLCFRGGDSKDILGIFAEVSKLMFAHEGQDDMKTILNISVKITDWKSGVEYGRVSFDGQSNPYDFYRHLTYKVHQYIKEESKIIAFGPGPDFLFSLDARLLSKILHLKGDKKGTLAISIVLDSDEKDFDFMRSRCCNHCMDNQIPPVPRKGRVRRWVGNIREIC